MRTEVWGLTLALILVYLPDMGHRCMGVGSFYWYMPVCCPGVATPYIKYLACR